MTVEEPIGYALHGGLSGSNGVAPYSSLAWLTKTGAKQLTYYL